MNTARTKVWYKVAGRNVVEGAGKYVFTDPVYLGLVEASSDMDAELKARVKWPGWHDYLVRCDGVAAA
jgi:hypothetical protein